MSFTLLKIRYIQLIRALHEGGLGTVLLPFFLAGLSFGSFKAYQNPLYGAMLISFLILACISIHLRRKDKTFVKLHLPNWRIQLYVEYVLITLPFTFTAAFSTQYYFFPVVLLVLGIVPFLTFTSVKKTRFKNISKLFPSAYSIEWISGIRLSYPSIFPLYILALAFCWMRFFPLLMLWFITTAILNFYNEYEALQILKSNHQNARNFLHQKIKIHSLYICYFYSPILVLNALFNHDFIDINILFLLVQLALLIFAIHAKYASYVPAQQNLASNVTVAIVSIGSIVPYLLPLPVIFAFVYYKKALHNLNQYFHD